MPLGLTWVWVFVTAIGPLLMWAIVARPHFQIHGTRCRVSARLELNRLVKGGAAFRVCPPARSGFLATTCRGDRARCARPACRSRS